MDLEKIKNIIRANFAADSFALGYHWTYDTDLNFETFTREKFKLISPLASQYHSRGAGEFSLYSDQNFALLKSISETKKFEKENFKKLWLKIWKPDYDEWIDNATKITLQNGMGSNSNDLSPVSRISPLFLEKDITLSSIIKNIEEYISVTHNNSDVIDYGKFIGNLMIELSEKNRDKEELFSLIISLKVNYPYAENYIDVGIELLKYSPKQLIKEQFPTYCEINGSGPLTIYFLLKFWDNMEEMFKWNAILDGDTCSRAGILASVIASNDYYPNFIDKWYHSLKREKDIEELLRAI